MIITNKNFSLDETGFPLEGEAGIQNQGEEFFDAVDEEGQEIAIDEFDDYSLPTFDPGGGGKRFKRFNHFDCFEQLATSSNCFNKINTFNQPICWSTSTIEGSEQHHLHSPFQK